ncbi:MAG: hypothetical protein CSA36_06390 [Draconibacterium sp.]|nr:MAG: hypothetical protein CSA36_06390 [Draconibacterium sp.]
MKKAYKTELTRFIFIVLIISALFSCGPSEEDKARARLNYARALVERHDTVAALLQLDSIHRLYPKAVYAVNAAKNLSNELNLDLLQNLGAEIDSVNSKIRALEASFVTEKTDIDRFVRYIPRRQTFNRSWSRSFIQVYLNETGELYISSNYYGKGSLNHVALRVYNGNMDAKTDTVPLNTPYNHHSDFMGLNFEKVTYRNGKDNGVIAFIAENADKRLKAVFLGKRKYYIILEDYDKLAVKEALALSNAFKKKQKLTSEIATLQKKLQLN